MSPFPAGPRRIALWLLALGLLPVAGCERVAPVRTLPSWVRGIYVPMFENETFEPGIEQLATKMTQEEFLRDGRLDVVPERDADLVLKAKITEWLSKAGGSSGDKITEDEKITMVVNVGLYEPFEDEPLAVLKPIRISSKFNIDVRSSDFEPEPDRRRALFQALGRRIVFDTITGFPPMVRDLPAGVTLPSIPNPEDIEPDQSLLPRRGPDFD
ncbi:MAG TPA: LPS assembly lipoprotein LptE [Candidatus Sumerlaeota bacterium]|nr:MAG: hypothetical protein BWZ08_01668 [candidate division BRC1 bacterium ADurb.BinA292]HOE96794.1 LPS assembly lipoprotein LptE [Candidatus Sumerlaeota bacterium]HOR28466.1 LPS assembly lipoprotein LptE [Candidatus Sumerlaeota bacterium]HPK01174.1 LPS assembly lipoprotein LptE [Candidatus Sumerlaeota bacterium]